MSLSSQYWTGTLRSILFLGIIVSNLGGRERRVCGIALCRSISSAWDPGSLRQFGLRRAQMDKICMSRSNFASAIPLCSSYHDLVCFSYVAMGCMAPVGSSCNGLLSGCGPLKGRSWVLKWWRWHILKTTLGFLGLLLPKADTWWESHILFWICLGKHIAAFTTLVTG